MYQVLIDGRDLYYPADEEYALTTGNVALKLNDAGSFDFNIPIINPEYNNIHPRISMIQVLKDGKELFCGEVREVRKDFYGTKQVYAVGELAFLFDSIQPQAVYHDKTPKQLLEMWLNIHNSQVEDKKKFYIGIVTVKDSNDSMYRFTNQETTLDCIRTKLCDSLNGYLRIRKDKGKRYLDLITLEDYGSVCEQSIEFGENLLDYSENVTADELYTCVVPKGARLDESPIEGLDAYVDIKSVNNGKDYLYINDAVNTYGWNRCVVSWDDVTEPENLKRKGENWLKDNQFERMTLSLSAMDLSVLEADIEAFSLGDFIPVYSKPHGMDRQFPCTAMNIDILDDSKNKISLGGEQKTFTDIVSGNKNVLNEQIHTVNRELSSVIQKAKDDFKDALESASGLYKTEVKQDDGSTIIYYHDKKKLEDSMIQMVFNAAGFGITSDGGKNWYGMQVDGTFISDILKTTGIMADWVIAGVLRSIDYEKGENGIAFNLNSKKIEGYLNSVLQDGTESKLKFNISAPGIEYAINEVKDGKTYERYVRLRPNNVTAGNSDAEVLIGSIARGSANVQISNKKTGKSMQIEADNIIFTRDAKNENSKTGRAEFSDGSYLEYINGILVGGRTANGTEF
ncbi:MAG: phage tail protein [Catenibacillus sp.]|nr:phage tail protein [Catenibacillus sp.]